MLKYIHMLGYHPRPETESELADVAGYELAARKRRVRIINENYAKLAGGVVLTVAGCLGLLKAVDIVTDPPALPAAPEQVSFQELSDNRLARVGTVLACSAVAITGIGLGVPLMINAERNLDALNA